MNRKQRDSNRENARRLAQIAREQRCARHVCENCGEHGGHWRQLPTTLEDMLQGQPSGFWDCKAKEQPVSNETR